MILYSRQSFHCHVSIPIKFYYFIGLMYFYPKH
nr:MAG TPA: hypothetical protein [Caudoviricetes sp.]DAQ74096.1 MAG TPA: hypothetical protein [Caudoviricetes sp.]